MKSKWISVFLALFMVLSLFAVPLQIWADGDSVEEQGEAAQEENVNSEGGTTGGGAADGGTIEGDTTVGGAAEGGSAKAPGSGEDGTQSSPEDPKPIHTVTILYLSNETPNRTLYDAFVATVPEGYSYQRDVTSPVVEDYELVNPQQNVIKLDFAQVTQDQTIEVFYKPIEVNYKISHYKEALDGQFVLADEEEAKAQIGTKVSPDPKTYEGFSFQGLQETYTVPKTNDELKIELKYTRNSYQISFDSDGGTAVPGGIFKYEADLTAFKAQVPQPTKAGYTFVGWKSSEPTIPEIPEKMPAQDLTFTAVWQKGEATPYLIRYFIQNADDNEYSYAGSYRMFGKTGDTITPPNDPDNPHPGLVFPDLAATQQKYWSWCFNRNTAMTAEKNENKTITADGQATVDVYYDRIELEVRYLSDGGEWFPEIKKDDTIYTKANPYSFKVRLGKDLSSLYVVTKEIQNIPEGYIHYTNILNVTKNNQEATRLMPKEYKRAGTEWFFFGRKYGTEPNQYLKMYFQLISKPLSNLQPLEVNVYLEQLQTDKNESAGYTTMPTFVLDRLESKFLKGWGGIHYQGFSTDSDYLTTFYPGTPSEATAWKIKEKEIDGKTVRYCDAYFKRNAYPLELHSDPENWTDGWSNMKLMVLYDVPFKYLTEVQNPPLKPQSIQKLEKTYHSEYAFVGWYLDPAYNIPLTDDLKMRDSGTSHLYAKWAPKQDKVTLSFDSDGGTDVTSQTISWGKAPTPVENPTKKDYRFLGWKEIQQNGLANYYFSFKQNLYQDVRLKAIWEKVISTDLTIRYVKGSVDSEEGELSPEVRVQGQKTGAIYTAQAKPIPGYLPDKVHKTLTLGRDGNVITFYYKPFTTINYIVKYIAREFQNGKSVETEIGTESIPTNKVIDTRNYKAFPGYTPVNVQEVLILSQEPTDNVMTFYYTKVADAKYTVKYYLSDGINAYQLVPELTETTGAVPESEVSVTPEDELNYLGHQYHFVKEKSTSTGIVKADNSLVLELYYQAEPQPAKEYTITFDTNGGAFANGDKIRISQHDEGTVITIDEAPVWAGHTFLYWKGSKYYPGEKYTVVEDHTFTAVWDKPDDPDKPVPYNPYKPSISTTPQSGFVMGQPRLYSGAKPQMPSAQKPITQLPATGSDNPAFVILLSLGLATLGLFLRKRS